MLMDMTVAGFGTSAPEGDRMRADRHERDTFNPDGQRLRFKHPRPRAHCDPDPLNAKKPGSMRSRAFDQPSTTAHFAA